MVDLQACVIDRPFPCAFDDPPVRKKRLFACPTRFPTPDSACPTHPISLSADLNPDHIREEPQNCGDAPAGGGGRRACDGCRLHGIGFGLPYGYGPLTENYNNCKKRLYKPKTSNKTDSAPPHRPPGARDPHINRKLQTKRTAPKQRLNAFHRNGRESEQHIHTRSGVRLSLRGKPRCPGVLHCLRSLAGAALVEETQQFGRCPPVADGHVLVVGGFGDSAHPALRQPLAES